MNEEIKKLTAKAETYAKKLKNVENEMQKIIVGQDLT